MAAHKGNKYATKLKTPDLKKEAYKQYCDHIAAGHSQESFVFEHPEISLTHRCLENNIKSYPEDFPPMHKQMSEGKSRKHWEDLGIKMMMGHVKGAQPAIYQMFMRNKFGWDKEQKASEQAPKEFDQQLDIVKKPKSDESV